MGGSSSLCASLSFCVNGGHNSIYPTGLLWGGNEIIDTEDSEPNLTYVNWLVRILGYCCVMIIIINITIICTKFTNNGINQNVSVLNQLSNTLEKPISAVYVKLNYNSKIFNVKFWFWNTVIKINRSNHRCNNFWSVLIVLVVLLDTCSAIFPESNHFHVSHVRMTETLGRMKSPSSYDQLAVTDHSSNGSLKIWIKREFGGPREMQQHLWG